MKIKRNTIESILGNYNETGKVSVKKRGGENKKVLSEEEQNTIKSWVDEDCTITLAQLVQKCANELQKKVSQSTINRVLDGFTYTLKNVHTQPERRNNPNTINSRLDYANQFMNHLTRIRDKNFIFIDEVGFKVTMRAKRGRSKIGKRAVQTIPCSRTRNISVCCAMTCERVMKYQVQTTPFNGVYFGQFLDQVIQQIQDDGINEAVFVIDNVSFHKSDAIKNKIREAGHELLFLPPYSPFLNPIENMFSKWKQYVKQQKARSENELMEHINVGLQTITSDNCLKFYQHMMSYIPRCLAKETITD